MNRFLPTVVLAVLMIGICANATAAQQEDLSPELQALVSASRLQISERIIQAENQFFENEEAFIQSAEALGEVTDLWIEYKSEPGNADFEWREFETINGRQLRVLSERELSEEQMALLRESGVLDIFSKTGCCEMDFFEDGIIYWWEPAFFFAGGIIYTKNRDGLESEYDIQKELEDDWVTFLYPNI